MNSAYLQCTLNTIAAYSIAISLAPLLLHSSLSDPEGASNNQRLGSVHDKLIVAELSSVRN